MLTVIQIDHDRMQRLQDDPRKFGELVAYYLRSGSHDARDELISFGAQPRATINPDDKLTVTFGNAK